MARDEKKNKIESPHLILCEGLDAKGYLVSFLQTLIKTDDRYDKFRVKDFGGNDELSQTIKMLPSLPGFSILKSLTVMRDAEKDARGASQSIQTILENNGFAIPNKPCEAARPMGAEHNVKVGYALFPEFNSDNADGTLEDLCLSTLIPTVDKLAKIAVSAVEQAGVLKRAHKNKLHTCLSLTDDFVGLKIGESARAKAFNFSASELEPLKALLLMMLE